MTKVANTTTAEMLKKYDNQPALKEIINAVNDGLDAMKKGDGAQVKLTHGIYHAFAIAGEISLTEAVKGCTPLVDPIKEQSRKSDWGKFIDGLCVSYSEAFCNAKDAIEETKQGTGDANAAKHAEAVRVTKAIQAMFRRAVRMAASLRMLTNKETGETIPVKVTLKDGLLRVAYCDKTGDIYDARSFTASDCNTEADAFWPKVKRAEKEEKKKDEPSIADTKKSLSDSIKFVRTMVTAHNWAAQDKGIKTEIQALYAELTSLFAVKDEAPAPVLIKKAKA